MSVAVSSKVLLQVLRLGPHLKNFSGLTGIPTLAQRAADMRGATVWMESCDAFGAAVTAAPKIVDQQMYLCSARSLVF